MFFASFVSLFALVEFVVAVAVVSPRASQELHTLAKAKGKLYFGSATDNPELTDAPYVAILSDHNMFGQTTPTNSMKWVCVLCRFTVYMCIHLVYYFSQDATEPNQGQFTFAAGDVIANLAKKNGQLLRGEYTL